jgi:hypothetical protein
MYGIVSLAIKINYNLRITQRANNFRKFSSSFTFLKFLFSEFSIISFFIPHSNVPNN